MLLLELLLELLLLLLLLLLPLLLLLLLLLLRNLRSYEVVPFAVHDSRVNAPAVAGAAGNWGVPSGPSGLSLA